jgi:GNAT superfamily N-acetyltransferase
MEMQEENVQEVYQEMDEILHNYFRLTIAKEGLPPLNMDWRTYFTLDQHGNLLVITARHKLTMLGFVMYHMHTHLHHNGVAMAACDILAVDLKFRGKGIARKIMEYAESALRARGIRQIIHMSRTCYDAEPLFPKLGYRLFEQSFIKELK